MKLEKSVFRYIEHELYNYKYTLQTIEDLRENIIDSVSVPLRETVPNSEKGNKASLRAVSTGEISACDHTRDP